MANETPKKDSAIIKLLAIIFPEAKVIGFQEEKVLKLTVLKIEADQFKNLRTLAGIYRKDICILRSSGKLLLEITEEEN